MKRFTISRLAATTLIATIVLIAFGGFTRGSGSGYGCADRWPLCENGLLGGFLPRLEYHMIIEWTHRWIAAVVGLLAILTALAAWRRVRANRAVVIPAVSAVFVIGFQAWLGRQVVKGDLDADLVSVHLAVSLIVVGLLSVLSVTAARADGAAHPPETPDRSWTTILAATAIGSYVLVILGSYVHNLYIPGWPLVKNTLFPSLPSSHFVVHFLHRTVAGVGFFVLLWLAREVIRRDRPQAERLMVWGAAAAFAVNVGLGAAHVFTKVQSSALVAGHLGLAAIVWVLLVTATTAALADSQKAAAPSAGR
jgi:cytochrome c oxidase assembly protein subunit 15